MLQGELSSATSIKRSLKSEVYRLEVELEAVHKEKDLAEDKFNGQLDSVEKQYDIERELNTTLNNLLKDETSKVAALEVERDRLDDEVKRLAASQMARDIVRLEGGKEVSKCELAHKVDRLEEEKKSLEDEMGRVAREVSRLEGEKKSEVEAVSSIVTFGYYFVLGYLFIILLSHNLFALVTFVQLTAKLAAAESQRDQLQTRNNELQALARNVERDNAAVSGEGATAMATLASVEPLLTSLGPNTVGRLARVINFISGPNPPFFGTFSTYLDELENGQNRSASILGYNVIECAQSVYIDNEGSLLTNGLAVAGQDQKKQRSFNIITHFRGIVGRQFKRTCGGEWPWEKVCKEGGWSDEILLVFLAYHQPILDALGLEWGMVMNGMSCFFLH